MTVQDGLPPYTVPAGFSWRVAGFGGSRDHVVPDGAVTAACGWRPRPSEGWREPAAPTLPCAGCVGWLVRVR